MEKVRMRLAIQDYEFPIYATPQEKREAREFMEKNKQFFEKLGKKEIDYVFKIYRKMRAISPYVEEQDKLHPTTWPYAFFIFKVYSRHYKEYTLQEHLSIRDKFQDLIDRGWLLPEHYKMEIKEIEQRKGTLDELFPTRNKVKVKSPQTKKQKEPSSDTDRPETTSSSKSLLLWLASACLLIIGLVIFKSTRK